MSSNFVDTFESLQYNVFKNVTNNVYQDWIEDMKTDLIENKVTKNVAVRLREDDYFRVYELASQRGIKVSVFIRECIQEKLERLDNEG